MRVLGCDQKPLEVSRSGQLFFQPLDLPVEPADLLIEFGLEGLVLVTVVVAAVAEQRFDAVQ